MPSLSSWAHRLSINQARVQRIKQEHPPRHGATSSKTSSKKKRRAPHKSRIASLPRSPLAQLFGHFGIYDSPRSPRLIASPPSNTISTASQAYWEHYLPTQSYLGTRTSETKPAHSRFSRIACRIIGWPRVACLSRRVATKGNRLVETGSRSLGARAFSLIRSGNGARLRVRVLVFKCTSSRRFFVCPLTRTFTCFLLSLSCSFLLCRSNPAQTKMHC
jgi:hypothetical protein